MMTTATILVLKDGRVLVGRIIHLDAGTRLVSGREEMPKQAHGTMRKRAQANPSRHEWMHSGTLRL